MISKSFSRSLEQFFLTVGQNNFGNKIPLLVTLIFSNILLYLFFLQIFQVLEFPSERERMTTVQNLTIIQRENLLKMIFNLTYGLDDDEMEALKGPSINYFDDKMEIRV